MEHANHPARNYDFAPMASLLGKYNTKYFEMNSSELNERMETFLTGMESEDKKPIPHTSPELVTKIDSFLSETISVLLQYSENRIPDKYKQRVQKLIQNYRKQLSEISTSVKMNWLCDPKKIADMFGIDVSGADIEEIINSENQKWQEYDTPQKLPALEQLASIEEVNNLFQVIREKLLQVVEFSPHLYLDQQQRHYLFWNSSKNGQECVIPDNYSLAEYLRFHCPHNDAHLAHLRSFKKPEFAYFDYMDERAFTEAIAVHSEWKMFEEAKNDDFIYHLHSQFSSDRKRQISQKELQDWLLNCRGYEFRLRLVRLLGDHLTINGNCTFNETVRKSTDISGIPLDEVRKEVAKYYHFTGLGACYTLGYLKLLNAGINQTKNAFSNNSKPNLTWHNFNI